MSRVQHVLFHADGVLQDVPGGWYAAMEAHLGDRAREFLEATWSDELPALAGQADYLPLLAAALAEYGATTSCYSYELGVAKPSPGHVTRAAAKIGAAPEAILFVDDIAANVEGARSAGLASEQWDFEQGLGRLLALLSQHGIAVSLAQRS
ncbi:MAG TPA: HAD-IA family hydrolase [Nocardioides sp.]|uniref:HAD-IA family hydrolase n=1 Tax=Nocardioides sp. TaxID=35761 RepID=UPI002E2F3122|nr:HAD-IA family hydrolase [Nocardioides sp.]HEX3931161.1 HAD-IA family hydrolase [Nocardioides sp.]